MVNKDEYNKATPVVLINSLSTRHDFHPPSPPSRVSLICSCQAKHWHACLPVPRCVINWSSSPVVCDNRKKMACRACVPLVDTAGGRGLTSWRRRIDSRARANHSITTPRIAGSERKAGNYRFSSDAVERTTISDR